MSEQKKSVLERATAHYQDRIKNMASFEVEEWGVTIYHRPVSTLAQEAEVIELARRNKTTEAMVVTIINKARDENGKAMFSKHDKAALMNEVDPAVILKIAERINGGAMPNVEELEKN